ncbi:MAG: phosphate/phosphite/phosphonate ABC transporter substrate-binding protein [Planctomycetota bacterium]|nr:phosphate/phosphite/phosphonate ABC transporter substrate-binding protein [Planctomycetota bacterium]
MIRLAALGALALGCLGAPTFAQAKDKSAETLSLTFGVYQTDKATVMYKMFTPVLEAIQDDMSHQLGRPVDIQLTIFKSYDDGIRALVDGQVDLVHFGPASYVTAKEKNPNIQLVAMEHEKGEKRFKGVIVVQKDSPIQTIEDLRGKRFAFGDKNSTIGRYLVQAQLVDHGIHAKDLASFKYMERHDQVAGAVELGDFEAGSVKASTFKKYADKGTLRKLAEFDNVTKPIVARAGFDPAFFTAVQTSFYGLKDEAALKELKISGFMPTSDAEYDFVREGMKKAAVFESVVGN